MWNFLPEEVVAEILWRLPIRSILRFRCVCKSWNYLITSSTFISNHLHKTILTKNPQIFLHELDINDYSGRCCMYFDDVDYFRPVLFQLPPELRSERSCLFHIVGCVNGVICFCLGRGDCEGGRFLKFFLYNPAIRYLVSIPTPLLSMCFSSTDFVSRGFAFDDTAQDYKIILLSVTSSESRGMIFSLKSNCWRNITSSLPNFRCTRLSRTAISLNGRLHWLALRYPYGFKGQLILVFDVKSETFGEILLPECLADNCGWLTLTGFGDSSIAVIQAARPNGVNHVWVMKEDGLMESWIKLATVGKHLKRGVSDEVLGLRNRDELFIKFARRGGIASQNIISNKVVQNVIDKESRSLGRFTVHNYMPSLLLLNRVNNVAVEGPTRIKRMKTM